MIAHLLGAYHTPNTLWELGQPVLVLAQDPVTRYALVTGDDGATDWVPADLLETRGDVP